MSVSDKQSEEGEKSATMSEEGGEQETSKGLSHNNAHHSKSSSQSVRPAIKTSGNGPSSPMPLTSPKPSKRNPDKPKKSVFIKANETAANNQLNTNPVSISTPTSFSNSHAYWSNSAMSSSSSPTHHLQTPTSSASHANHANHIFAGINGSIGGGDEDGTEGGDPQEQEQFRRKRAGHYNEFKVLQAMRAKMKESVDDDDDDDDEEEDRLEREKSKRNAAALPARQRSIEKMNQSHQATAHPMVVSPLPPEQPGDV